MAQDDQRTFTIRDYFKPQGLLPFTEDDLGDSFNEAIFANRAFPAPIDDLFRMARQPELGPIISDIEAHLRKFSFGKVSLADWEQRYRFPRKASIKSFEPQMGRKLDHRKDIYVVNGSDQAVKAWVAEEVIPAVRENRDQVSFLIGGIGSGKSTLNKYVTSKFFEQFKENKIVTSRIEYQKLYQYINNTRNVNVVGEPSSTDSTIKQYIYCCILRDIFHYGWSTTGPSNTTKRTFATQVESRWRELDITHHASEPDYLHFVKSRYAGKINEQEALREAKHAIRQFQDADPEQLARRRWFYELIDNPHRQAALEPFVQYAVELGIKFFVLIDGLDYVQVSDFLKPTSHKIIINTIGEWLASTARRIPLRKSHESIYPTFQVTMRINTYDLFWRDHNYAFRDVRSPIYYVVQPEFRDIFDSLGHADVFQNGTGAPHVTHEELKLIFDRFQKRLLDRLELRKRDISKLFMHNIRFRVHYVRNLMEELIGTSVHKVNALRLERVKANYLAEMRKEADELSSSKDYRLVDMLLHSKNERFANFIRIESDGIDLQRYHADPHYCETVLRDNNVRSGYVGNIFNYHIPYKTFSDIHYFLERLRILDILVTADNEPMSEDNIKRKFTNFGWNSSPYFDVSVAIMLRENLVAANSPNAGDFGYVATDLGRIMRTSLVKNMIYLENVFFGCFLPAGIKWRAVDIYRGSSPSQDWSSAAIYHCWLLLRLIRTAELGAKMTFFEDIRKSVASTVSLMTTRGNNGPQIETKALQRIRRFGESLQQD